MDTERGEGGGVKHKKLHEQICKWQHFCPTRKEREGREWGREAIDFWKCSWAHAMISRRESWLYLMQCCLRPWDQKCPFLTFGSFNSPEFLDDSDVLCRWWNLFCNFTLTDIFRRTLPSNENELILSVTFLNVLLRSMFVWEFVLLCLFIIDSLNILCIFYLMKICKWWHFVFNLSFYEGC